MSIQSKPSFGNTSVRLPISGQAFQKTSNEPDLAFVAKAIDSPSCFSRMIGFW